MENKKEPSARKEGPRGFAMLSEEQRRAIASKGGKTAHARGTAHRWTSEEAAEAGRRGGGTNRLESKKKAQPSEVTPEPKVEKDSVRFAENEDMRFSKNYVSRTRNG